jgi:DNA repair protein RecO (recombination protein O)
VPAVPAEKSWGIVLKVIDFSESSCVVTLFTRDFGKITALAKGARRPKGPFESALDLLALVRVVFLRKAGDVLDLLTEAKLERRFRAASQNLTRLYAGFYVIELLNDLTHDDDPHTELFDLAAYTLQLLDSTGHVPSTILRFELAALHWLGHKPSLEECVTCGNEVPQLPRVSFGLIAGGILCQNCRGGQRTVVSLSAPARQVLQQEFTFSANLPEEIDKNVRGELRGLLNQYVNHLIGHRPKMQAFFGMLMSG